MAALFVQATEFAGSTGTTVAKILPTNPVVGNLLIVKAEWLHAGSETATCADTFGNVYTSIGVSYDATNSWVTQLFWAPVAGTGSDQVTVTMPGSRTFPIITIHEVSGCRTVSPLDVWAHAENVAGSTTTDAMTSGAAVTTVNGAYIFGGMTCVTSGGGTKTAGTGFTMRTTDNSSGTWSESLVQSVAGSIAAKFTLTIASGAYEVVMAAFKPAASAPVNTVAPSVTGTTTVGQTLTTTNGTWTDAGSPAFTYAWQRDVAGNSSYSNIASATASTYALVSADAGCHARCVVTDTDVNGATAANSNVVGLVIATKSGTGLGIASGIAKGIVPRRH